MLGMHEKYVINSNKYVIDRFVECFIRSIARELYLSDLLLTLTAYRPFTLQYIYATLKSNEMCETMSNRNGSLHLP